MTITISFPGGKKVNAEFDGHVVQTDQSPAHGGEGSAPEPFSYFLASLATCAGIFALGFCQARGLSTEGLKLTQDMDFHPTTHALSSVTIRVQAPAGFPAKYLQALSQAVSNCTVKRTLANPPEFKVDVSPAPGTVALSASPV